MAGNTVLGENAQQNEGLAQPINGGERANQESAIPGDSPPSRIQVLSGIDDDDSLSTLSSDNSSMTSNKAPKKSAEDEKEKLTWKDATIGTIALILLGPFGLIMATGLGALFNKGFRDRLVNTTEVTAKYTWNKLLKPAFNSVKEKVSTLTTPSTQNETIENAVHANTQSNPNAVDTAATMNRTAQNPSLTKPEKKLVQPKSAQTTDSSATVATMDMTADSASFIKLGETPVRTELKPVPKTINIPDRSKTNRPRL